MITQPKVPALVVLSLAVALAPSARAASCGGTCTAELGANPAAVQRYVKKASAVLSRCLKAGAPACPTACALPDPATFGLGAGCGARLRCELAELAAATAGEAWDASGACARRSAATCDVEGLKRAGKLAARMLSAVRKGQAAKLGRLMTRCESDARRRHACPAGGAACDMAEAAAQRLMESLYAACDDVPLSEAEMNAAVDKAMAKLAKNGLKIGPESWHDATGLFALVAQTFRESGCLARAQSITPASRTSGLQDGQTVYCGPNSCTKGAAGCVLPDPGACLNAVCASHDDCYGVVERSECIRRDCTWSSQTQTCDANFFVEAGLCWTLGQCGFTCKAVIAAATALTMMNLDLERTGTPCPRRIGDCPTCPGECQSDCTCSATPPATSTTTTTTLPPGCEFSCGDGECVVASAVCNGTPDCPGGGDEDPSVCFDQQNCCVATRGCPAETGSSCAATCCCCPFGQACCADWSQGCCASP